MRKIKLSMTFLCLTWAPLVPASGGDFHAISITVTASVPDPGDSARITWEKLKTGMDSVQAATAGAQGPVYLVKVYVTMPSARSEGYRLWVGEDPVREYGGFKDGIFFKLYDPIQLTKWAGKPLRMGLRGQTPEALGVDFPILEAKATSRAVD